MHTKSDAADFLYILADTLAQNKASSSVNEFHGQQCLLVQAGNQFKQRERSKTTLPVSLPGYDLAGESHRFHKQERKKMCAAQHTEPKSESSFWTQSQQNILFFIIHKVFFFFFFKKTAPLSRYQQTMLLILLKVDTIYVIFKSKGHLIC